MSNNNFESYHSLLLHLLLSEQNALLSLCHYGGKLRPNPDSETSSSSVTATSTAATWRPSVPDSAALPLATVLPPSSPARSGSGRRSGSTSPRLPQPPTPPPQPTTTVTLMPIPTLPLASSSAAGPPPPPTTRPLSPTSLPGGSSVTPLYVSLCRCPFLVCPLAFLGEYLIGLLFLS